jgi:type IV pilus assembly protein PilO
MNKLKLKLNIWAWEQLKQDSVLQNYCKLIAVLAFLIAMNYWFVLKPNFIQYDELIKQEINLRSEFEKKQQESHLQAYRKQLHRIKKKYDSMQKQFPAESEMSNLLDEISKTGLASGLIFELFAPTSENSHDFYTELAINIIVLGEYQQLASFLSRVSTLSHLVSLHDFEIMPASLAEQKMSSVIARDDLLRMKIIAKIYRPEGNEGSP